MVYNRLRSQARVSACLYILITLPLLQTLLLRLIHHGGWLYHPSFLPWMEVIESEAEQSRMSYLIVLIRLLRRCAPRSDLVNDFLRVRYFDKVWIIQLLEKKMFWLRSGISFFKKDFNFFIRFFSVYRIASLVISKRLAMSWSVAGFSPRSPISPSCIKSSIFCCLIRNSKPLRHLHPEADINLFFHPNRFLYSPDGTERITPFMMSRWDHFF